ncbi:uncharacterized protein LOC134466661 [Engraulis encrasicolus]|uniref:uncharacterized protein LOC134466661 n=1 Tax=Engraulis encrasicolus TaxID=184585 RepID=UPI002FD4ED6C
MDLIMSIIEPVKAVAEVVYGLFKADKDNQAQCQRLAGCVHALLQTLDSLKRQYDFNRPSKELQERLEAIKESLDIAEAIMRKQEARGKFKRVLKAHKIQDQLDELYVTLDDDHKQLTLLLQVEQRGATGDALRHLDEVQQGMNNTNAKASAIQDTVDNTMRTIGGMDTKLDSSQQKMDSLHGKMDRSQKSIDDLNEKMDKLFAGQPAVVPTPGPNPTPAPVVPAPQTPVVPAPQGPVAPPAASNLPKEADKLLFAIRGRFVEKVTLPVIKGLLDTLRDARVLNEEEAESVLEEQSARADRARCLVDTVRKKGQKASQKMVDALRDQDPSLAETLGL